MSKCVSLHHVTLSFSPSDISDCERDISSPVPATVPVSQEMHGNRDQQQQQQQQAALNYTSLAAASAAAAVAVGGGVPSAQDPSQVHSSTETLLRNIQGLLKVAADNARQQERQTSYEKGELKEAMVGEILGLVWKMFGWSDWTMNQGLLRLTVPVQ